MSHPYGGLSGSEAEYFKGMVTDQGKLADHEADELSRAVTNENDYQANRERKDGQTDGFKDLAEGLDAKLTRLRSQID